MGLSLVPMLGAQRCSADPIAYAHGHLLSSSWFVFEYDGEDAAMALVDDSGPLRIETFSVQELEARTIELGELELRIGFRWHEPFHPRPLSALFRACQRRVRHFPRPSDGIARPDPLKTAQTFSAIIAANRWRSRP